MKACSARSEKEEAVKSSLAQADQQTPSDQEAFFPIDHASTSKGSLQPVGSKNDDFTKVFLKVAHHVTFHPNAD